jgi:hypothetical protein
MAVLIKYADRSSSNSQPHEMLALPRDVFPFVEINSKRARGKVHWLESEVARQQTAH